MTPMINIVMIVFMFIAVGINAFSTFLSVHRMKVAAKRVLWEAAKVEALKQTLTQVCHTQGVGVAVELNGETLIAIGDPPAPDTPIARWHNGVRVEGKKKEVLN